MRFRYHPIHGEVHLNLTPLIDVVFLLIIFFLVTSSFVYTAGVRINLPQVSSTEYLDRENLLIEIDQKGRYFFREKLIEFTEVSQAFTALDFRNHQLTIRADKDAPFEAVIRLWDLARANGVSEIVVLAKHNK